jgi:hypothetical protein
MKYFFFFFSFFFTITVFAQAEEALLKRVRTKLEKVNDYTAPLSTHRLPG